MLRFQPICDPVGVRGRAKNEHRKAKSEKRIISQISRTPYPIPTLHLVPGTLHPNYLPQTTPNRMWMFPISGGYAIEHWREGVIG